jgi:hypothetical protein
MAQQSPSGSNNPTMAFVIVRDEAKRDFAYDEAVRRELLGEIDDGRPSAADIAAAPSGPSLAEVQRVVESARSRVRETVSAAFGEVASTEVRDFRERVLGAAHAALGGGDDVTWGDVLDNAFGANNERLFDIAPDGTIRAAVTRGTGADQRVGLYVNRDAHHVKSLLHELIHINAWEMDDSAVRRVKGVHAGLEGTQYGTHVPGTPLSEAEHEWLVSQFMIWMSNPDAVHPTLHPLMKYYAGKLGSISKLRKEANAPANEAIAAAEARLVTNRAKRAKAKTPKTQAKYDALIAQDEQVVATAKAAKKAQKGGIHPDIQQVFDESAAKAAVRTETRASTFDTDEQEMLMWMQVASDAAARRSNDLIHFNHSRSFVERSVNHPFLGLYPASYMWGKVLPNLAEFLLFRPFGFKAPLAPLILTQEFYQSFERQQQYDEELRNFLYMNEPYMRAMSMVVPGLPWDLPVNAPAWIRRVFTQWEENNVRAMNGQKPRDLDIPGIIKDSMEYQLNPLTRQEMGLVDLAQAVPRIPEIAGTLITGKTPEQQKATTEYWKNVQTQQPQP